MSISSFCQEGRHRPALSLFAKVSLVFSCKLPKSACSQKFAFAKRSAAMKAPVGLLSNRTVLRSKMEGPCPDKFTLTWLDFCGNLFQQFNITYLLRVPARLPKEPEQVFNFLSLHNEPEPRPSRKEWSGSGCCVAIFLLPNPAPNLENRMTVCMGYPAMTSQKRAGKRRRKGAGNPCRENG